MNNTKKTAKVIGRLLYPLTPGMPAFIKEEDGVLKTSRVVSVETVTPSMARFETLNTNYCVRFEGSVQHERA